MCDFNFPFLEPIYIYSGSFLLNAQENWILSSIKICYYKKNWRPHLVCQYFNVKHSASVSIISCLYHLIEFARGMLIVICTASFNLLCQIMKLLLISGCWLTLQSSAHLNAFSYNFLMLCCDCWSCQLRIHVFLLEFIVCPVF